VPAVERGYGALSAGEQVFKHAGPRAEQGVVRHAQFGAGGEFEIHQTLDGGKVSGADIRAQNAVCGLRRAGRRRVFTWALFHRRDFDRSAGAAEVGLELEAVEYGGWLGVIITPPTVPSCLTEKETQGVGVGSGVSAT